MPIKTNDKGVVKLPIYWKLLIKKDGSLQSSKTKMIPTMKPASGGEKIFFSAAGEKNAGLFFVSLSVSCTILCTPSVQKKVVLTI